MRRLTLSVATVLVAGSVFGSAAVASAGTHVRPTINATTASFTIPASPTGVWELKITTNPAPHTILGIVTGTSGTLSLNVPQTPTCDFQVDALVQAGGTGPFVFYSSIKATVPGCGQNGNGQRLTPGYWKTHEAATTALLPQSLGGYSVSTFAQAQAVFDAMKCSDAIDCLAGHLLAAELDVANGSSTCISGVIFMANELLTQVNYAGPASYPVSSSQRAKALKLEQRLDSYTNDSTSSSC
jgi:hypothetical protein